VSEIKNNRAMAFEIFREAKGSIKLTDIALQLQIPEGTVRGWKARDRWNEKLNGTLQQVQRCTKKRNVAKDDKNKPENAVASKEELTDKEELFCLVYVNNFNATMAYLKAFGGKYNSASVCGYRLLGKANVKAEITRLKAQKAEALKFDPQNDIVERYMRIAFADMGDFVEFGREEVPVMTMLGPMEITVEEINPITGVLESIKKRVTKVVNSVRFKEHDQVDGALICQIKQGKDGASIKLEDRQKALEWLANYFEMNPMNRHKKDYDKSRLALEKEKLELTKEAQRPEEVEDDGFIDALNAVAGEVWSDEDVTEVNQESSI
jgi:phage terminase small subunit